LENKNYKIKTQVMNFQGKVIGVLAINSDGQDGFIPCFPSSPSSLHDFRYMDDNVWNSYEDTLMFLKEYYDFKDGLDCHDNNSFCRVIEDEMVIGFLTNTNQFVQIKAPIPVSSMEDDEIKNIRNDNLLVADINTLVNNKIDSKRVDFMKRIQLETNFYNVFRNTIRMLFNDYSNSEKRKTIQVG
jgi:hypothetical protein